MIGWLLLATLVVLAVTFSPWWWIGVVFLGIWKVQRWYFYNGRPWRRVHYPMMRAYAAVSGFESGEAQRQCHDFDLRRALKGLLHTAKSDWTENRIDAFIDHEYSRCQDRSDVKLLEQHIKTKNQRISDQRVREIVDELRKAFNPSDKGLMVRLVIAGVIEDQYGSDQRGEYLFEVLMGNAK